MFISIIVFLHDAFIIIIVFDFQNSAFMWTVLLMILGILGIIAGIVFLILGIMQSHKTRIILGSILTFIFCALFFYSIVIAIGGYFNFMSQLILEQHNDSFMRDSLMDPQSIIELGDERGVIKQIDNVSYRSVYSGFVEKNGSSYYYTSLYFPLIGLPEDEIQFENVNIVGEKFEFSCSNIPQSLYGNAEILFYYSPDSLIGIGSGAFSPFERGFKASFNASIPNVEYIDFIVIKAAE